MQTLLRTSQSEFPVVDDAGKPVGLLGRADIIRALKERGPDARVADAMTTERRRPSAIASASTTRSRCCRRNRRRRSPSSMPSGRLVGLVTSETIGEMMMVREALPKGATVRAVGPVPRT